MTNLAVHFKLGRQNVMAWVTSQDKGVSVANAQVAVSDCNGKQLAKAATNAQGVANFTRLSPDPGSCGDSSNAYFVSARSLDDLAFT